MGGVVLADWDLGDPALHYQLPDASDGWSVYGDSGAVEPVILADDWTAEITAPITDIHFWGGWRRDYVGETLKIHVQIFNNNPAEHKPDESVWSCIFNQGEYIARPYQDVPQGFYDPRFTDDWETQDHDYLLQYGIQNITSPFIQQEGQTYWIAISTDVEGGWWGWNTTGGVSGSSAVFWDETTGWTPLLTPTGYQDPRIPLDMAFVLVPEPSALLLFALAWPLGRCLALRSIYRK